MIGKLFIVGTPIGNLSDFSPRGIKTLDSVDFIAAEDTRITRKLLTHFEISTPLLSYHQHNSSSQAQNIVDRILLGETAAIVSDAGMPVISDPGQELINLAHSNNIEVLAIPGPTAAMTALALSGITSDKFMFEGFLKGKPSEKRKQLQDVMHINRTLIYYEAPHKLIESLLLMLDVFGNRKIAISREITKIYEETIVLSLAEAVKHYKTNSPRGEFVIIVENSVSEEENNISIEQAVELVLQSEKHGASLSAAAKEVASLSGYKKGELYKKALDTKL